MLTPEEEKFLVYWSDKRNRVQSGFRHFKIGLSLGLVLGIAIILNYATGWYTRATMVANSQSTPLVLIIGIIIIALFMSFFYSQFSRENNEQRYQELLAKKEKQIKETQVQQPEIKSSQVDNS